MWNTDSGQKGSAEAMDRVRSHENLGNTVYLAICDGLTKGQFKPGDPMRIRDLADFLGTSITPVRDAVLRLVHDQALVMKTARDIRVPILTPEEYQEIREIRLNLEALAAKKAAENATPDSLEGLVQLLKRNEEAIDDHDYAKATECNQVFHFALTEIAGMPLLKGVLHRLWLRMGPIISAAYEAGGRTMIDTHYDVLDALRKGDGDGAAAAIQRDIVVGGSSIMERIRISMEDAGGSWPKHKRQIFDPTGRLRDTT